ncbi:hypothetical protein NliqN6_5963 [Naganishia liquefaciens]|uniref:Transcription factor domain-containing protein n=1 Tax=Naganishia liquefaciens TaxID=104408 RepID=A0A8H3YJI6_9TREE|nr:hypothetical protein NliqN6_5963 [Naganishia liquefaciens]
MTKNTRSIEQVNYPPSGSLPQDGGNDIDAVLKVPSRTSDCRAPPSAVDESRALEIPVSKTIVGLPVSEVSLDVPTAISSGDDIDWNRLLAQMTTPLNPATLSSDNVFAGVGSSAAGAGFAAEAGSSRTFPIQLDAQVGPAESTGAPWSISLAPRPRDTLDVSPMLTLCLDTLVQPQVTTFFTRIAPMIPIFSLTDIQARLDHLAWQATPEKDFVGLVLAMTALSLVHPLTIHESVHRPTRFRQAQILIDEALRLRAGWSFGSQTSVEAIMTSYLIFGALYEMGHLVAARMRLREAVALGEAMGLDEGRMYVCLSRREAIRRLKMFWVLSVTERAYSLQHGGKIVFESSISADQVLLAVDGTRAVCNTSKEASAADDETDPPPSLKYLAHLFSYIDQDLLACWNGRCAGVGSCRSLTESRAVHILGRLGGTAENVFGVDLAHHERRADMTESQRADLLITWQWLRNRMWKLAERHGMTTTNTAQGPIELSHMYLARVAIATLNICKGLSTSSMDAHGAGFAQKLYDIASAVPELLRQDVVHEPALFSRAQRAHLDVIVRELYGHVARYRSGQSELVGPLAEAIATVAVG